MFRLLGRAVVRFGVSAGVPKVAPVLPKVVKVQDVRTFSVLNTLPASQPSLLCNPAVTEISNNITRNVTKYSWRKGKRKSVKAVLKRFYRLNWGIWIRTKCGRNKKIWKKRASRRRRLRQHVFCNATQSRLLDKMVGPYWRKPRHYVEDPYNPYHVREEFVYSSKKPRPYFPPEENA